MLAPVFADCVFLISTVSSPVVAMSDNLPPSADDPGAIKSVHNLMAHEPHLNGIEVNVANAREDLCYARLRHPAAVGLCLFVLSGALYRRYQQTWQSCDVDECVELLREVIALLQRDYPEYTKALSMPVSASLLFRLTMPTEDSSASLIRDGQPVTIGYPSLSTGASYRTISMTIPELLWKSHINLCHALAERSIFRDSTEDAEEQINVARCVLAKLPEGHDLESEAWCALGTGLYIRCQRKGDRQDLHDALLAHRQATGACHARGYVCAQCLYTTACCLCLCDVAFSDRSCLSEALILLHEALCILPEQSVHHPRCHLQLGLALLRRLHLDGSLEDEKLSENHLQKALALLSRSHPQRGVALRALGVKSGVLYEQTSDVDAIHFAINCCREALEFQPEGNPERCRTLQSLSSALSARYELLGAAEDLSSAVEYVKESLKLRKTGRALTLQSLAALMSTKYDLCGDMSCLEDAIALYREALSLSHHGSEIHNVIVNNLGDALLKYHKHTGELVPLVEAVRHFHWVLDHRPLGHPRRGTAVVNLGEALVQRYKEFGNIEALDEAIKLYARWIERGNGNFFGQDEVLHQYATALLQCPASNIDESIHQYQCALKLRPLGNWARHRTLGNLASAFAQRFEIRGDVEDALTARKLQQEVMEILPATHPDRPLGVFGVARLLLLKSSPYFDISAAIDLLVSAVQDPACHPQVRLTEALGTAQKIIGILEPNLDSVSIKMLDAYRLMIAILPLVAFFGLNPRSRLRALEKASELASDAAFCAVQVNRVTDALEVLEEGRAVFWAQHLRLRARADGIPDDITRQLTSVSEQLRQGVVEGVLAGSGDDNAATAKLEAEAARMRRLSEEFDLLINKARCTPGNERFLMPRIFASLAGVAERGPVVLFIASQSGCTAILLMDSGRAPVAIKFPRTSLPDLQALSATVRKESLRGRNSLQNRAIQITQAKKSNPSLRVLWETIMQPVLQALGWQVSNAACTQRFLPQLTLSVTEVERTVSPSFIFLPHWRFCPSAVACGHQLQAFLHGLLRRLVYAHIDGAS